MVRTFGMMSKSSEVKKRVLFIAALHVLKKNASLSLRVLGLFEVAPGAGPISVMHPV